MLSIILVIALSYLAGSFPTSIITGKILKGIDIREHGSGNAGATNVFRVLGWKPGVFVMLFDIFKGFAATWWLSRINIGPVPVDFSIMQLVAGCAAIFGHIWTVFAGFKGGKGVGTAAGMIVALYPLALVFCLGVFILVFLLTKIVSLSSIAAAITLPIVLTIFRYATNVPVTLPLYLFGFFASALIIYTHRTNIKRLLNGTENRFGKKKTA